MKRIAVVALLLLAVACTRSHKLHGRVTNELKVQFDDGVVGSCVFDNDSHPGDEVTMNDDGTCHDVAQ